MEPAKEDASYTNTAPPKMSDCIERYYPDAEDYWSKIPATINGMLGGYGHISHTDIQGSNLFLNRLFKSKTPPGREYALDCGAGIGRISKHLLLNVFEHVDLLEQNCEFLEAAREYIGPNLISKVDNFFPIGLQHFRPEQSKYDVIWVQWVMGHLCDSDFVNFLVECKNGLRSNGMIVIKENVTSSTEVEIDQKDFSVTRPLQVLKELFKKAELDCYLQLKQTNFPKELYTVYMFALRSTEP